MNTLDPQNIMDCEYSAVEVCNVLRLTKARVQRWFKQGLVTGRYQDGKLLLDGASLKNIILKPDIKPPTSPRTAIPFDEQDAQISYQTALFIAAPCIYFLRDAYGAVVYVGKTVNWFQRIATHHREGKVFASVSIRPTPLHMLDAEEERFIAKYKPPLNRVQNGSKPLL